jgi:hypothetical protein
MSSNMNEYVYYIDSHNAEQKLYTGNGSDPNPTNDIIIPCRFPQRLSVAQMSLGSLEIPLTQYNIESDWQTLFFDEGLDLLVVSPTDDTLLQFIIDENGTEVTAQLPPKLNPIVGITPLGAPTTSAIFTTQFPHQLDLRGFFNWGDPMKVCNTPLSEPTYTNVIELTESNTSLTIISETEFQLSWPSLAPVTFNVNLSGVLGYVTTPSIPSPQYLAALVTLALNQIVPNHWAITYNTSTGKFKLCYTGSICNVSSIFPATLIIPVGTNSLAHIMGFGCVSVNIPPPAGVPSPTTSLISVIDRPRDIPNIQDNCLISIDCSPCKSQIEIDIGNYDPNGLMGNLSRQLNRFYFDPGCNLTAAAGPAVTSTPINFVYSNGCGQCYTLVIPFGLYSPDNLATYIQTGMTANISSISVTFNINTGQFQFTASDDFGLEFDVSTTELAYRLGFYPISYRNEHSYSSTIPFYLPSKGCCGTTIPERHLSYVYSPLVQSNQRKFIVQLSKTRCIQNIGAITDNGDGTITITTTLPGPINIAHGFQIMDVIEVDVGGVNYFLVVTNVNAYNMFTAELGSISAATFVGEEVCLCLEGTIATNLYFSCVDNNVLARTLGYSEHDALWNPLTPTTWIPPACFMLDWPQYVLINVTEPDGATRNNHAWKEDETHTDTMTKILAKVILYPQYRLERSFPFHMYLPDLRIINRLKIQILNPDHSLYRLHSRDWSATFVFHAVEKSINQLCY